MSIVPRLHELEVRIDEAAADVARLRRRLCEDEYGAHLVDRVAFDLLAIDAALGVSAAELVAAGYDVDEALEIVDRRDTSLQRRLGMEQR